MYTFKIALVLGIIGLAINIYGQDIHPTYDYCITMKNDTLKCKIKKSLFHEGFSFNQNDEGDGYKYKLET